MLCEDLEEYLRAQNIPVDFIATTYSVTIFADRQVPTRAPTGELNNASDLAFFEARNAATPGLILKSGVAKDGNYYARLRPTL